MNVFKKLQTRFSEPILLSNSIYMLMSSFADEKDEEVRDLVAEACHDYIEKEMRKKQRETN